MTATLRRGPRELWKQLQLQAGLELRLKSGKPGRDADLDRAVFSELVAKLGPMQAKTVDALLQVDGRSNTPRVSVEMLLVAVLTSQRGFAAMMKDILDMLIVAQAKVPERSLSIEFKFDAVTDPIRQTLEEFRATVERVERVLVNAGLALPNKDLLWALNGDLQALFHDDGWTPNTAFERPQIPSTGHANLDELLAELLEMVSGFQQACSQYGYARQDAIDNLRARFSDRDIPEHREQQDLATAASDYWDVTILSSLKGIANSVIAGVANADDLARRLETALSKIPRRREWMSRTYQELLNILTLPTWQKRNELYSVWVGTALLRTARRCAGDLRFHAMSGVLSFSFGGSRLASYDWGGKQYDIWCELRSALMGTSEMRKKGVQPDFRVVESTIAMGPGAATRFVLECKHYLAYSLSNFSAAAKDYARSCPNALVFLVNHGPADHDLLIARVDDELAPRVKFLGNITADTRISPHTIEIEIQNALFSVPAAPGLEHQTADDERYTMDARNVASITLWWTDALTDLDLAVEVFDQTGNRVDHIYFGSVQGASKPPLARLHADQRTGPGSEMIEVSRWEHARYEVTVTNYSKSGDMRSEAVHCLVTLEGKEYRFNPAPSVANSYLWRVAAIDVATRQLRALQSVMT